MVDAAVPPISVDDVGDVKRATLSLLLLDFVAFVELFTLLLASLCVGAVVAAAAVVGVLLAVVVPTTTPKSFFLVLTLACLSFFFVLVAVPLATAVRCESSERLSTDEAEAASSSSSSSWPSCTCPLPLLDGYGCECCWWYRF